MLSRIAKYSAGWRAKLPYVFGAVFVIHASWVATHVMLVADDRVDPWKLGGYGMYTTPSLQTHVEISYKAYGRDWRLAGPHAAFASDNADWRFLCRPPTERSIRSLLEREPVLEGRPVAYQLTRRFLDRAPIGPDWRPIAAGSLTYNENGEAVLAHEACGETHVMTITPP